MLKNRKLSVVFALFSDLRIGRGSEIVALNYIKYAPLDKVDITVIQTNFISEKRLSEDTIGDITKNIKFINHF